jgi:membrane-bound metal-dependent hydrolase YbcI (DUF457 family)
MAKVVDLLNRKDSRAVSMYIGKGYAGALAGMFKLKQDSSFKRIILTSFIGVYFHILLDAPAHAIYDLRVANIELTPVGLVIYFSAYFPFSSVLSYTRSALEDL